MKRFLRHVLTGCSALSVVIMLALLVPSPAVGETSGQQVFETLKCNMCHDVSSANIAAKMKSAKMKGPDLTGVGTRYDADWIAKYLRKEVQLEGKDHKKEFKGTDEELTALVDWLQEQKGE